MSTPEPAARPEAVAWTPAAGARRAHRRGVGTIEAGLPDRPTGTSARSATIVPGQLSLTWLTTAVDDAVGEARRTARRRPAPAPATPPAAEASRLSPPCDQCRSIWLGERQAFDVGTLKQVMLTRGFSADTLALAAGIARGTMYTALAGRSTRLSTARRILEALAAVEPRLLLSSFLEDA